MSHSTSIPIHRLIFGLLACILVAPAAQADDSKAIPPRVSVLSGAINTVAIKSGDKQLAVYGSSSASQPPDLLLLTHHRRDVLGYVDVGAGVPDRIAAPAAEREWISQPELFWAQYNYCLDKLRSFTEPMQLVNEHIPFVFQFTAAELKQMTERYEARTRILQELFPWDSPDYGIDEQWAAFYPYEAKLEKPKADTSLPKTLAWSVRVNNHSPVPRVFAVLLRLPKNFESKEPIKQLKIEAGGDADLPFELTCNAEAGVHVITASILSEGMEFHDFIEGLVTVP